MPNPGQELSSIDFESMIGGPLIAVVNAQAQAAMSTVNFIKEVGFEPGDSGDPQKPNTGRPIYVTFKYPKEVAPYQPASKKIKDFNVSSGGSGYTSAPKVTIDDPTGSGASAEATIAAGSVTGVTLKNPGSGYTAPTVTIEAPPADPGGGATATATANVEDVQAQPAQFQEMKIEVPMLCIVPIPFIRVEDCTIDFNAKINSMEYKKTDSSLNISGSLEAKAGWLWGSAKLKVSSSYKRSTSEGSNVERTYSMAIHVHAMQDELPAGMEKILGILEDAIRSQPTSAPEPSELSA